MLALDAKIRSPRVYMIQNKQSEDHENNAHHPDNHCCDKQFRQIKSNVLLTQQQVNGTLYSFKNEA